MEKIWLQRKILASRNKWQSSKFIIQFCICFTSLNETNMTSFEFSPHNLSYKAKRFRKETFSSRVAPISTQRGDCYLYYSFVVMDGNLCQLIALILVTYRNKLIIFIVEKRRRLTKINVIKIGMLNKRCRPKTNSHPNKIL